jgi:hypothetical protein
MKMKEGEDVLFKTIILKYNFTLIPIVQLFIKGRWVRITLESAVEDAELSLSHRDM